MSNNSQTNNGLIPSCWGPTAWHFLHSITLGYPETTNPNGEIAQYYKQFFINLGNVLPCDWCRTHYKENIKTLPIDSYLGSRRDIANWLYKIHNLVNDVTNVPKDKRPTFEDVYKKYDELRVPCNQDTKTCGGDSDRCYMVIKNANKPFSSPDNIFKTYWPLMIIIVILLIGITLLFIKK